MDNRADSIKKFILKEIAKHQSDIVAFAVKHFNVSRMTIHRHLNKLVKEKKIIKFGTTRQARYFLPSAFDKELIFIINHELMEFDIWEEHYKPVFMHFAKNIMGICEYGFTEIFNNAIEHSEGKKIIVTTHLKEDMLQIYIFDDGIGIFKKLKNVFHFQDMREGVLALSKGKLTTDPKNHTGEGIFFASRAFDRFCIGSNGIAYIRNNLEDDWFVETREELKHKGTSVFMEINIKSKRNLKDIFAEFTNPETFAFNKTHIMVQLCKLEEERYISRSQAKRLLWGLEKFQHIVLDFKNVVTVGQGFVDEVFRVYKNKHPEITIEYINANEDVVFMIKRGIATAAHE